MLYLPSSIQCLTDWVPLLLFIRGKTTSESLTFFFISGTDLFSSAAPTDFNMEKIHFKSSVATKPQT